MKLKLFIGKFAALLITLASLLLLTSPLWIGWIMEYEHNKTKSATVDISLGCEEGSVENREVWSKLGIAIFCEKNGVKHGEWQAWDGGYMHITGNFLEGKKNGVWKYFNALGEQWGERIYSNGQEISELVNLLLADSVLIKKNLRKLYLIKEGQPYRTYDVNLGAQPLGDKQEKGDERTPEGWYEIDYRKENSNYYKSLHISYPNKNDENNAIQAKRNLAEDIFIHGQPNGFGWAWRVLSLWDWTDGSIAVKNQDMDEIFNLVEDGTPIEILP